MKMNLKVLAATFVALVAAAAPARAEIVFLQSGRTLSVKGHRYEGDSIILSLRKGGTVTCDRSLIERIAQDEVPYDEPKADEPPGQNPQPGAEPRTLEVGTPYGEIIATLSQAHGVDPVLVSALIKVESGYRPRARSRKGAMGLMQLMPSTAREYKVRNPFDPKANIEAGVKHLKTLIDRFDGGIELALAAYNAGEAAVKKFNGIPPYRETRNYVSRILAIAGVR
jgi:soluble lytic murein transglycosylase-like protein